MKEAKKHENYRYYHLLSGMDLPLKTQDQIHQFFDSVCCEFVDVSSAGLPYHDKYTRAVYPLLKLKKFRSSKILKVISEVFARTQLTVGFDYQKKHNTNNWIFSDGWTWWSITNDLADYIINNESAVECAFKLAKAPDEFFVSTLLFNSDYMNRVYSQKNHTEATMRMIDWKCGKPYTFHKEDFEDLVSSPYLFARKFDEQIDSEIIDMIVSYLKK